MVIIWVSQKLINLEKRIDFQHLYMIYITSVCSNTFTGAVGTTRSSDPLYRPGLSAGISGAGYLEDGRSVTSSVQSSNVAAITQALSEQAQAREQR